MKSRSRFWSWTWRLALPLTLAGGCTGQIISAGTPTATGTTGTTGTSSTGNSNPGTHPSTGVAGSGSGVVTTGNGGTTGTTVSGAAGTTAACTPGIPVTSQIARLTNAQYDATINDLLGLQTLTAANGVVPSTILATDQTGSLTDLGWSAYQTVADMISTQVMADATLKKNFVACSYSGDGSACLKDTVTKFGRKAFRRPLSTDETNTFNNIITNGKMLTADGTPDEIAQVLLYMFLISPSFLQRAEINQQADSTGQYFMLSSYEIASRLSYMLWGSTPDATLSAAADNGQLTTSAQILTQAQRLLADPRARDQVAAYHRYYLLMGTNTRWDTPTRDTTMFPDFSTSLIPDLEQETQLFFDNVTFAQKGTFQDLLTSPVGFVNAGLAPMYGLDPSGFGSDLQQTQLDPVQRPGFLTRVGFLNAYSSYNRTSPILRGAFITKQVLGIDIGAPPPGASQTPLPDPTADLNTNRLQVDAQTSDPNCAGCHHTYINPPGFVLEAYNAVGTWQTTEASTGAPIDTTADVMIDGNPVHVNNPSELMQAMAQSQNAQHRYAELWVAFAYERLDDPLDSCTVDDLGNKIAAGTYTIQNLITDLTQAQSFTTRAVGVTQ